MSKLSKLLRVTEEEKKAILKKLDVTEDTFEQSIALIEDWINKNPNLPKGDNINKIKVALLNGKLSLEKTKKTLEGYYRVRTVYADFFDNLVPSNEYFIKNKKYTRLVAMPNLTPDMCRVTISRVMDVNGEAEDGLAYYVPALMIGELRILHDFCLSNILVVDMVDYGMKNLLKFTPSINKKLVNILNALDLRIKEVHIINCTPVVDRVMSLVKSMLPAKLIEKIHTHTTFDTLHAYIPKHCLPKDYDGTEPSMEELYNEWCKELETHEETFKILLKYKSKEQLDTPTREVFGMGTDGSFKRLAID